MALAAIGLGIAAYAVWNCAESRSDELSTVAAIAALLVSLAAGLMSYHSFEAWSRALDAAPNVLIP